jgi:hypothetical protein
VEDISGQDDLGRVVCLEQSRDSIEEFRVFSQRDLDPGGTDPAQVEVSEHQGVDGRKVRGPVGDGKFGE